MTRLTYVAHAHREGSWWVAAVAEQGVATQARRLDLLEAAVRDLLAVWLDVPDDSFDVEIDPEVPRAAAGSLKRARKLRNDADRLQGEAAGATREAAQALLRAGLTLRDAGVLLGVSYQRVAQLVAEH
ncbi:MAG TPA: hypothetical protein VFA96_05070 [Nocardioides sp.]|nr:hypothetical protein [Nocardioides sp.]